MEGVYDASEVLFDGWGGDLEWALGRKGKEESCRRVRVSTQRRLHTGGTTLEQS